MRKDPSWSREDQLFSEDWWMSNYGEGGRTSVKGRIEDRMNSIWGERVEDNESNPNKFLLVRQ